MIRLLTICGALSIALVLHDGTGREEPNIGVVSDYSDFYLAAEEQKFLPMRLPNSAIPNCEIRIGATYQSTTADIGSVRRAKIPTLSADRPMWPGHLYKRRTIVA